MKTKDLITEANSLPVEERALIVDSLLMSFNAHSAVLENEWLKTAKSRLAELQSGIVKPVSGEKIFEKIRKRFEK